MPFLLESDISSAANFFPKTVFGSLHSAINILFLGVRVDLEYSFIVPFGHHGCPCHVGVTKTIVAISTCTSLTTLPIRQNGADETPFRFSHNCLKPSVPLHNDSGFNAI